MGKKVLFILPNNLGDVIMGLPAVSSYKKKYPETEINFLVEQGFEPGIENCPDIRSIIEFPRKPIRDQLTGDSPLEGVDTISGFISGIREEAYETVVNLFQHDYMASMIPLMRPSEIRGKTYNSEGVFSMPDIWTRYLFSVPFKRDGNSLHASDIYRRISGSSEYPGESRIHIKDSEASSACNFLKEAGVNTDKRIAVLQSGSAYMSKQWPRDHFVVLANRLISDGWEVVLTGAPSESDTAEYIAERSGSGAVSAAGSLSFRESMALLRFADACVSGDTAVMHAASGLGVRCYALFGPTNPVETGPYGDGHFILISDSECSQCFNVLCTYHGGDNKCLSGISPDDVYSVIRGEGSRVSHGVSVYRTGFNEQRDYELRGVNTDKSLYDSAAAVINQGICTEGEFQIEFPEERTWEIERFVKACKSSRSILAELLKIPDQSLFEKYKASVSEIAGIGGMTEFVYALLNFGLDSVGMIDPVKGLQGSVSVFDDMIDRTERLLRR